MGKETEKHPTEVEPISLAEHGWFYVGGRYEERENGTFLSDAMYVERYVPTEHRQPYPVVMFHGGGQTGTNYLATPDGRRGWLHDFLRAGYAVYLVDQPERGRSGHSVETYGAARLMRQPTRYVERRFTAGRDAMQWPQARHHTQWPGSGLQGDPAFDQFYAAQAQMIADRTEVERLNRDAGVALLGEIGPAILLTHSQSGPFGWLIADARPDDVKAILAIEPNGPPFHDVIFTGAPDWFDYEEEIARPWGIARLPLAYDPPAAAAEELAPALQDAPDGHELVRAYLQPEPARSLPNLKRMPILMVTAEASFHTPYDHCTSRFLAQAGVDHDFVRLPERGLCGNAHMVMLERNNHEIADLLINWLAERVPPD